MKQAERLLTILRELPRGRGCSASTARALATRLQASERSIYRDVALLSQTGYPVAHDGQGYFMLPTDEPLLVKLTADEVASLLYATQWAERAVPAGLRPNFDSMVDKLVSMYGTSDTLAAALAPDQAIDISPKQSDGTYALANICLAIQARRKRRRLRGLYYSPDRDEQETRILHPYAVTYRGDAHYLVAYCELRQQVRTFRLDRFRELEVIEQAADIPDDYDLSAHFSGAWEVTGGRRTRIVLLVRGKTARRMRFACVHPSQETCEKPDGLEVRLKVAVTDELCSWILGLGPDAEVIAPKSLRRRIAALLRENLSKYLED